MLKKAGIMGVFLLSTRPLFAQDSITDQVESSFGKSVFGLILFILLCAILLAPFYDRFNTFRLDSLRKRRALKRFTPRMQNVILMVATAAKIDQDVNPMEVAKIQEIVKNLTNIKISKSDVSKIIELASDDFSKRDIQGSSEGISAEEKRELLFALFAVISADGVLHKREREFSKRLCKGLRINQVFFDSVWVDFFKENPKKLTIE